MKTGMRPSMYATLRNPEFRALWIAETQSMFGDQLTTVALSITVYSQTGSALWAAVVYSLIFLPALAGGLGLSQLADRYPRRTVLTVSALIQAVLIGLMAIPGIPLPILCGIVVFAKLTGGPQSAAQNALTREIFTDDELYLRSQDLRGITTNTAMLLGLAIGGFLVTELGVSWSLAFDALTFFLAAILVRGWVRHRPAAGTADGTWFGAIRWVFSQRRLRVLIWLSWLVGLAVVPEGLAAPLAHEIGAPEAAIGWLLAADPLGFVLGTFLLSHYVSAEGRKRALGFLAVIPLAILIAFAGKPSLPVALILLAMAGAAGAYLITVTATFMTLTPNELRGGAAGLYRTGVRIAQGIGIALGGVLAQILGSATTAIAIAGGIGVALAIPTVFAWTQVNYLKSKE